MKKRYSCISIISQESLGKLKALQDKIFLLTGSELYRQQRPLHITVGVGNELEESQLEELFFELQKIAANHNIFTIHLHGIKFEENPKIKKVDIRFEPYIIKIGIQINSQLQILVNDIDQILRKYNIFFEILPYDPHITIAGRDLSKAGLELLQKELGDFDSTIDILIDSFSLVLVPCKENKALRMKEIKKFDLGI